MWSLGLSIYMIPHYKTLKTHMVLHDLDNSELQWLERKQYNMFLKPLTTPLTLILFVFIKCKEKYYKHSQKYHMMLPHHIVIGFVDWKEY
jgi:hypothetical protein